MPDPAQAARDLLYDYVGRPARLPAATRLSALKLACPPDAAVPVCAFWAGQAALEQGKLPDALAAFGRQLVGSGETWRLTLAAFSALVRFGFAAQAEQLLAEVMPGYRKSDVLEEGVSTLLKLLQEPGLTQAGKDAARTVGQHYIAQLLGADPFDYWHRAQAAEIEFVTGSPDKAIEMYEQAIADTPWEAGLYNNLAYLLSRVNRDLTHGLELAATAIAREPANNVFYLDTRGWLLYRAGRLDEAYDLIAASLFRGQLGLGYTMAECSIHLGTVELARNHKPEAIAWFRLAAALDRDGDQGRTAVEELRKLGEDPFRME
jgi:tetratricopeptide (TPR) repeat protein